MMNRRILVFLIVFLLANYLSAQEKLETYTLPCKPNKLNELEVKLDPPEGWEVGDIKYFVLKGTVDGKLINGVYTYTDGPGSISTILFIVVHKKCDENLDQIAVKRFLLVFEGVPIPDPENPDDPDDPPDEPTNPKKATYVYEKDEQLPSRPIQAALRELNQSGKIQAGILDKDQLDGTSEIPDQFKEAVKAAEEYGVPCLVVEYSNGKVKVIKNPTEQDIKELQTQSLMGRIEDLKKKVTDG